MPTLLKLNASGNVEEIVVSTGNFGTAVLDFGAGGGSTTSLAITGQTSIATSSIILVAVQAKASADHTADEHFVEELEVRAGNIVAGTGFTIYARTNNKSLRGQWNVAWTWGN